MMQIPQQPTSSLSTHVKAHRRNYVGNASQFVSVRKRIFNCNAPVEGKQTAYAERQTQSGFNCQMQSSSVTKDHT